MSLRREQYNSLKMTQRFLRDLLTVDEYPKKKREMREQARRCLRHFPFLYESGQPMWSRDEFTKDEFTKDEFTKDEFTKDEFTKDEFTKDEE